ncbi:MAG: hypothetical protein R3Y24_13830 [Eubacteriales bacterium]
MEETTKGVQMMCECGWKKWKEIDGKEHDSIFEKGFCYISFEDETKQIFVEDNYDGGFSLNLKELEAIAQIIKEKGWE